MFFIAAITGLFLLTAVTLLWLLSLILKDASIIDIAWGLGFVSVYWFGFIILPESASSLQLLFGLLVTIWGMRLAVHLLRRNWGKPEDYRYARWRKDAGKAWWWRSYFKVFLLQGVVLWVVSWPLLAMLA